MIMETTNGKGVVIVLISLAGELFEALLKCLGENGRFLELGKVDFYNRTLLDSYMFLKNCSFHGIFVDKLVESVADSSNRAKKIIYQLLADGKSYLT